MAHWRVDYLGKKATHLGTVEAPDEKSAIAQAAEQFNITPARRFTPSRFLLSEAQKQINCEAADPNTVR
jgi:hypothetical protein